MNNIVFQSLSKRFLITTFLIALPIFILIRWDSTSWFSNKVNQAATQAGVDLKYKHLNVSNLALILTDVVIQQRGKTPIQIEELKLSPSFSALFSASLAAEVDALWLDNPISAQVSSSNNILDISAIDAMLDMSRVKNLNIPAQLSGLVHITGDIKFDQSKNLPQQGLIHATWSQAMAGLAAPEFNLGDYAFDLNSLEDVSQPWQWEISGGSGVALNGTGTVSPTTPLPEQWLINGLVDAKIDQSNPSLSMMMQSMMGSNQAKLKISGSLGAPRTDIVR
ncbi:MAG: hypothetical protein R8M14_05600 [Ghiorsea sp.]